MVGGVSCSQCRSWLDFGAGPIVIGRTGCQSSGQQTEVTGGELVPYRGLQRKTSLVIQFLRDLAQPYPPAPRWLISLLSFPLSTGVSEQILLFVFFFKQFLAV